MTKILEGWRFTPEIYPRQYLDFGSDFPDRIDIAARTGELQAYCQNALRRYMLDGHANTMLADAHSTGMVSPLSNLPPYTFQIALALTIPASDYKHLAEFGLSMVESPTILSNWFRNIPSSIKFDAEVLYNIPGFTLEDMKKFGVKKDRLLINAIIRDDLELAKKVHGEIHSPWGERPTDGDTAILNALAMVPFEPKKIRDWIAPKQIITFHELHRRVKHQIHALSEDFTSKEKVGININHKVTTLPRFDEYKSRHADEFGVSLFVGLSNISQFNPQDMVLPVLNELIEHLHDALGSRRQMFFLARERHSHPTHLSDLEDDQDALMEHYFRHLFHAYGHQRRKDEAGYMMESIRKTWFGSFLERESHDVIMSHCRSDDDLKVAYEVTGNKAFLNRASESAKEDYLSTELGL